MKSFERLMSPGIIGGLRIPNRMVVAPMVANMNPDCGLPTEQYIRYHEEKAKGGWGLIITEDYRISEHAGGYPHISGIYTREQTEAHKRLTDVIHGYESKIFAQIYHAGRQANSRVNGGVQPVSCSPIPCPWNKEIPRELTVAEIKEIVADFAHAAENVRAAGFDGVEIHAAHGYLIHQFLSLNSNKRTDEYGGSYEGRIRFLREIMTAVRGAVGADFPLQVRISAADEADGGRSVFDSHQIFKDIEAFGADSLHVTFSMYGTRSSLGSVGSFYQPHGYGAHYAAEVKRTVDIPVIACGSIHDPYMMEDILESSNADFVASGRMSLCDPHMPNKIMSGNTVDIRPCVRCLQGCTASTYQGVPLNCMVNPEVGHEYEYDYSVSNQKKKIFVIGGGIAGMEAARAAKIKGHDVTLFEKTHRLGGQFELAAYPPYKGDFAPYLAWLRKQIASMDIDVRLNAEFDPEVLSSEKPDRMVVATGARSAVRTCKGMELNNVVTCETVLSGKADTGMNIVVIGGGMTGAETAAYLAVQCKASVVLTTRQSDICTGMESGIRDNLKDVLNRYFVKTFTYAYLSEVTEEGVFLDIKEPKEVAQRKFLPCDTVVTAFGAERENVLAEKLASSLPDGCDMVIVGDAREPRTALEAVREGFSAGFFS